MDDAVDVKYRRKHFPPSYFASKLHNLNPSNASQTVPSTAHHSLDGPPQNIKDLLAGFQGLNIEPARPEIEGMLAPPCPISTLPHEILVHILMDTAILDIAAFVRLAQVCKRLAYMVNTEEQIWKRICLGSEVGFGAMHYQWQREISGCPLEERDDDRALDASAGEGGPPLSGLETEISSLVLLHNVYSSSWQKMFRLRPRIRFNGCYISTVNYIRPGQASPSQITWNSPVHIVTYYRYLRFFRDGTVISLQTTTEPGEVVNFLTKSLQEFHKDGQGAHLPSAVMQSALHGRWRLSSASDNPEAELKDAEGDLVVETEGVGKYIYRMELSLRSAGKGARNNKLAWKTYYHYNKFIGLDDRAEFTLRNDKAFFWSRVKSYGMRD
jgi:F-box protein 9